MRLHTIEFGAQLAKRLGEAACRHDERLLTARPAFLDTAHDSVDRFRLAEHHARANTILRPAADHVRRHDELRRWQLRRSPQERLESSLHTRCNDPADEYPVARDAIEGRGRSHIDDESVATIEPRRGECA